MVVMYKSVVTSVVGRGSIQKELSNRGIVEVKGL
jgi:hypothetical protein